MLSTSPSGPLTASAARRAQARADVEDLDAAIASFFGATKPRRPAPARTTTTVRMDAERLDKEFLPPYSKSPEAQSFEPLPEYEEPFTLARQLFFYGFG